MEPIKSKTIAAAALRGDSVPDQRQESAGDEVKDALAWLGDSHRCASRGLACRPGRELRLVRTCSMRTPQAHPLHLTGRVALAAPARGEKNGRRPHRCLQSEGKTTSRRPQTGA
jgi:hypothetical protein